MATKRNQSVIHRVMPADLPWIRYGRVSRVGGRKGSGYISPTLQDAETLALANARDVPVHPEFFLDENYSGGNTQRPRFKAAMGLIESGQAAGLIVKTLDRFSRNLRDALEVFDTLEDAGCTRMICGDGDIEFGTGDPMRFMAVMKLAIADDERGKKGRGLAEAIENAVTTKGVHLGEPFGYRHSIDPKDEGRLAIVEAEAVTVRLIFTMRAEGASWGTIADAVNTTGAKTRNGRRFTAKGVHGIVKGSDPKRGSVVYTGTAWNGDYTKPNAHPAIVTEDVWQAATAHVGIRPLRTEHGYLLTGLMRCAGCGYVMVSANTKRPNGDIHRSYRCRSAMQGGECNHPASVPANEAEAFAWQTFMARFASKSTPAELSTKSVTDAAAALKAAEVAYDHAAARADAPHASQHAARRAAEAVTKADHAVAAAEAALKAASMAIRSAKLPPNLAELANDAPVADKRDWLATVYAAFVVRSAACWREPAADRTRPIPTDDVPAAALAGHGLIGFVAAMGDTEPAARIEAA